MVSALVVALVAACTGERPREHPAPTSEPAPPATQPAGEQVYVSVGDSYATGYRPAAGGVPAGTSRDGFAYLVARRTGLRLVNVACSGATSTSVRERPGCSPGNRGPGAPDPAGRTQIDEAIEVLRAHEGRVGLVTVVIGGNDLAPCVEAGDVVGCAAGAVGEVRTNLAETLPALREAAGDAPIVGLTYPDVFLGAWGSPDFPDGQALARQSVVLFRDFFNPVLAAEYAKIDATFVDVTEATGGYGALTGAGVPAPVTSVCELTYFCSHTDVHPTPEGHRRIAAAVSGAY
ncbi:hypothetical protein BLA60_37360 [Actinophytocola xinjiangensis]|uniref:SGNH hydrolase-type esterase domain-containing protein n=1 Tax=Actinophytocola xinjiangensis TaxID=485602 RepID=A0A7Z0WF69_9PSEU|nr:hypothetical protein BLA60_37360 [Actinophytocola xinjiangensis]